MPPPEWLKRDIAEIVIKKLCILSCERFQGMAFKMGVFVVKSMDQYQKIFRPSQDIYMSQIKNPKERIAVFFGGRSPEHDVSVVSGLQVLNALDSARYESFPVYITTDGFWYTGDALRKRENFLPDRTLLKSLTEITPDIRSSGEQKGYLIPKSGGGFFGKPKPIGFDVAIPVFHGLIGEDGNMQGVFETARIPYAGMRTMASSITMDKAVSKTLMQALGIPTLPFAILRRPLSGYHLAEEVIKEKLSSLEFPVCVKPCHLGSSIGVAKANSIEEVSACLPAIFRYDSSAIVEPFVQNLVEYNAAVRRSGDRVVTSAIERPKNTQELLDFKQKYLSGGGKGKSGTKTPGQSSEGMLSLTRELNPALPPASEKNIRDWAVRFYEAVEGTGAPRIDFIGNSQSGEIWMNEINPFPGSLGYFLWEASKDQPILFTNLLTELIQEAKAAHRQSAMPADPVPMDARLLTRTT